MKIPRLVRRTVTVGLVLVVGVGLPVILVTTAKKPAPFKMLADHQPIRLVKTSRRTDAYYSFPCRFFDVRKRAEMEMDKLKFARSHRPEDTGRWWWKDETRVMLGNGEMTVDGRIVVTKGNQWKWVWIHISEENRQTWVDRVRSWFTPSNMNEEP